MVVRHIPDPTGRFGMRPYWLETDLDRECERIVAGFLRRHRGRVQYPLDTEDLKTLIEEEVESLDQYADLAEYGADVEGVTELVPGRKPRILIASTLAEDERRENRFRTTLAHEYGHVRFHGYLIEAYPKSAELFAPPVHRGQVVRCKRDTMLSAPRVDWMEWQAGHVSIALLMPVSALRRVLSPVHERLGSAAPVATASPVGEEMLRLVAETFRVSRDAARVRLSRLGYLGTLPSGPSLFAPR